MIKYKQRQIDKARPVRVYRDTAKGGFSVQQGGLVVAHTDKLMLANARFRVSEKGRLRVIREKSKNFHAYVEGMLMPFRDPHGFKKVGYNPYRDQLFHVDGRPIHSAKFVAFVGCCCFASQ